MMHELSHISKGPGIGGTLKAAPQDFLVEEISPAGEIYELGRKYELPDEPGGYTRFILQKKNWTTASAISEVAKRLGAGENMFNIAGSKDKLSISTQAVSVKGDRKGALSALSVKDISINGAWLAKDRLRLGDLLGNRFTIRVRDCHPDSAGRSEAILAELGNKFPNYFGPQRFGSSRRNTHLIGRKLLAGELEDALVMFLCDYSGEKNEQAVQARKELEATRDFGRALQYYPKNLRLERSVIAYLAKNPGSHANALRRLPRNILLLFVHALQSDLFNRLLSDRISEGGVELEEGEYFCGETLGFPDISKTEAEGWVCGKLIGYGTPLNERERALLAEHGIEKDAFRMRALPEISSKGSYRTLLAPLKDFSASAPADSALFRFSLPSGSYATMAMREFIEK